MRAKQKSGVTVLELLIILVVLGILASIAIPTIGSLIERTRLNADIATVTSLNAATRLYRLSEAENDPFLQDTHSAEALIALLVEDAYLSNYHQPQSKQASYYWSVNHQHWFLIIDEAVHVIPTEEKHFTVHSSHTNRIIAYDGMAGSYVVIPETINGIPITEISGSGGVGAFQNKGIETVILPSSIQVIANNAFRSNEIQNMVFPNGLVSIGISAFQDNQITEVILPDTVLSISENAFHENAITSIVIGAGVSIGGSYAFGVHRPGGGKNFHEVYQAETGGAGRYHWDGVAWIKE